MIAWPPAVKWVAFSCDSAYLTLMLACRERGARALEERLGARKAVPAGAVTHDLESGGAKEGSAEPVAASS